MNNTGDSLAGLAVVVTRPAGQSAALYEQLQAAGASTSAIPLIQIEPLDDPNAQTRIQHQLAALPDYQHAIFISLNAAEQAITALRAKGLDWPPNTTAHGVGRSTAEWLCQQGIPADYPAQMNSEGLLAMPTWATAQGQSCLIFRGQGGRETLAAGLRAKGMAVEYCELYRRSLPEHASMQWQHWLQHRSTTPAVVCINSMETLDNLLAVDEHCTQRDELIWLVPGERVATAARQRGFASLIVAADATDRCVMATLTQWHGQQHQPKPT